MLNAVSFAGRSKFGQEHPDIQVLVQRMSDASASTATIPNSKGSDSDSLGRLVHETS